MEEKKGFLNSIKKVVGSFQDFADEQEQSRILKKEQELKRLKDYNKVHSHEQFLDEEIEKERKKKEKNKPKEQSLFGEIKF